MLEEVGDIENENYATSLEVAAAFLKLTMDKMVMGASAQYSVEDLGARNSPSHYYTAHASALLYLPKKLLNNKP